MIRTLYKSVQRLVDLWDDEYKITCESNHDTGQLSHKTGNLLIVGDDEEKVSMFVTAMDVEKLIQQLERFKAELE